MRVIKNKPLTNPPKLKAVIIKEGEDTRLVVRTAVPRDTANGFPCHIIGRSGQTSLTTGDLEYWVKDGGIPIYEGESVTLEF